MNVYLRFLNLESDKILFVSTDKSGWLSTTGGIKKNREVQKEETERGREWRSESQGGESSGEVEKCYKHL